MSQVEVYNTNSVNLATLSSVGAVAYQSSVYFDTNYNTNCPASIAIDGSFSNTESDPCRGLAHTNAESDPR
jgi:hypothetical protein